MIIHNLKIEKKYLLSKQRVELIFIKQIYRHSKTACFIIIGFLLAYIYINFKWGVVATPILQFGMYSTPFYVNDTVEVYVVEANGKIINGSQLSFVERDIVQLFLYNYERQEAVNQNAYYTMHKYFEMAGLGRLMDYNRYNNHISDIEFTKWYKQKLEKIIHEPVHTLAVYKQNYIWHQNSFQTSDSPVKLTFIVP